MNREVKIKKGSVLVYRIFDIAEELNMPVAESKLKDFRGSERFKVPKYIDRGLIMKSRPVAFGRGEVDLQLECGNYKMETLGKVRDYGVLSLIYEIKLAPGTTWTQLVELAADLEEGSEIDEIARKEAMEVADQIKPALKRPITWDTFEDYVIYFLEEFEDDVSARNLVERADVAALMLAEDDTVLAKLTRQSIMENIYQYSDNDLAFVEWNSALVVEPNGVRDVPDILEFALTHLLEFRFYDDLLDRRLNSLYDDMEKSRGALLQTPFGKLSQEASTRYIEFSEFIEKVENSLKVVGDFYLATVYRAATKRFRLQDWQQNITRKMNLLAQVSSLLQGEVNIRRSHLLEITVILLIAFEILSTVLKVF